MEIRVIVPAYNEAKNILKTLKSISMADIPCGVNFDCIIVANGCTDRTYELARTFVEKNSAFKVYEIPRKNKAEAINFVLKMSNNSTICVVIDSDTSISSNFVKEVATNFATSENIHLIGADYVPVLESIPAESFLSKFAIIDRIIRILDTARLPLGRFQAFRKCDVTMNDDKEPIYPEDHFISLKIWKHFGQGSLLFNPNIVCKYYPPANWTDLINQRTRWVHLTQYILSLSPFLRQVHEEIMELKTKNREDFYDELVRSAEGVNISKTDLEKILFVRSVIIPENARSIKSLIDKEGNWKVEKSTKS